MPATDFNRWLIKPLCQTSLKQLHQDPNNVSQNFPIEAADLTLHQAQIGCK